MHRTYLRRRLFQSYSAEKGFASTIMIFIISTASLPAHGNQNNGTDSVPVSSGLHSYNLLYPSATGSRYPISLKCHTVPDHITPVPWLFQGFPERFADIRIKGNDSTCFFCEHEVLFWLQFGHPCVMDNVPK